MKKNTDPKSRYLDAIKTVVIAALKRQNTVGQDLCPLMGGREPDQEALKELAETEKTLRDGCQTLREIEKESGNTIGVAALTGQDAGDPIRIAFALLAAQALTAEVRVASSADLCDIAGSRDTGALVELHESWRRGGVLRERCTVDTRRAANFGELRHPSLKETALRTMLGMVEPDDEFDRIDEARAVLEAQG